MFSHLQRKHIPHTCWLVWGVLLAVFLGLFVSGVFVGFAQTTQPLISSNITNNIPSNTQTNTSAEDTQTINNPSSETQFASLTAQLEHGAQNYDLHCATCHGDTGRGFAEAKLAFPEDHRRCHYCHRRNNPPQMPLVAMTPRNAFDIGQAPALVGAETLSNFGNASALHHYSQATMPRPFPGELDTASYLAITVHILRLRDALPAEMTATNQPIHLEQLNQLSP